MRIGIDISVLCNPWDGIGTYVFDELEYISSHKDNNEYYLYAYSTLYRTLPRDFRFHYRISNSNKHIVWLLVKLPLMMRQDKLDVMWQPNFILPYKVRNTKNIIHVHDLSAYSHSNYAPRNTNITHKLFLRPSISKADRVLTISENANREVLSCIPEARGKTKTIYLGKRMFENGLDATDDEVEKFLLKYRIFRKEYILFVGTLSPRKNDEVIIKSFIRYKENGGKLKLVIAGNVAQKSKRLVNIVNNSKYRKEVVFTGYVSEKEKRILYYNATMLLFPSRLEGFGYPILEGFQAQIPVIVSNKSCLPEIAGDAGIYLNNIDDYGELAALVDSVENFSANELTSCLEKGNNRLDYFESLEYLKQTYQAIVSV